MKSQGVYPKAENGNSSRQWKGSCFGVISLGIGSKMYMLEVEYREYFVCLAHCAHSGVVSGSEVSSVQ